MHPQENRLLLFLISSNGVPKHWTTSVNKGDTEDVYNWAHILRRNWCYQLSLPSVILATIFFNTIFLFTNFLSFVSAARRSARNSCSQGQCREKWTAYFVYKLQSSLAGRISRLAQIEPSKLLLSRSSESTNSTTELLMKRISSIVFASVIALLVCHCHVWSCRISDIYFAGVYGCFSMLQNWRRPQKLQVAQSPTSYSP